MFAIDLLDNFSESGTN